MIKEKEAFLKRDFIDLLEEIPENTHPVFGKMNVHQMIEHMSHAFQIANGKVYFENKQSDELTAKMYRFIMSDRPFRDNTPNPNLSDTPLPPRFQTVKESIEDLIIEIKDFFEIFKEESKRIEHPFFGHLNRDEQIHLLHKHALHHLRQFNVIHK